MHGLSVIVKRIYSEDVGYVHKPAVSYFVKSLVMPKFYRLFTLNYFIQQLLQWHRNFFLTRNANGKPKSDIPLTQPQ